MSDEAAEILREIADTIDDVETRAFVLMVSDSMSLKTRHIAELEGIVRDATIDLEDALGEMNQDKYIRSVLKILKGQTMNAELEAYQARTLRERAELHERIDNHVDHIAKLEERYRNLFDDSLSAAVESQKRIAALEKAIKQALRWTSSLAQPTYKKLGEVESILREALNKEQSNASDN